MKTEPLTKRMLDGLKNNMTPTQVIVSELDNVDMSKGRAQLDEQGRQHCMWTTDGRRITVTISTYGEVIVSKSKVADPDMP